MEEFKTAFLPTLSVRNGVEAVNFYKKAFAAEVVFYIADPDGAVVAQLSIDGVQFIVVDEAPEYENLSPKTLGGSTIRMGLIVADPDAVTKQAVAAGASEIYPVANRYPGHCSIDPCCQPGLRLPPWQDQGSVWPSLGNMQTVVNVFPGV